MVWESESSAIGYALGADGVYLGPIVGHYGYTRLEHLGPRKSVHYGYTQNDT